MARQWEGHGYFPWAVRWGGPGSHYSLPGYSWAISTCDCNLSQSVWCHFTCSLCPEDLWCATWLWSRIMESKIWLDSHYDFLAWSQYTQNKSIWGSRPKPMTLEGGRDPLTFRDTFLCLWIHLKYKRPHCTEVPDAEKTVFYWLSLHFSNSFFKKDIFR